MAWTTPKIDWAAADGLAFTDMNALGNNLQYLRDYTIDAYGEDTGGDSNYVLDLEAPLREDMILFLKVTQSNTAVASLSIDNGSVSKEIRFVNPLSGYVEPLILGMITPNSNNILIYNGTYWLLIAPLDPLRILLAVKGAIPYAMANSTPSALTPNGAYKSLNTNAANDGPEYQESLQSLMTAQGDMITSSAARTPIVIPKGTAYKSLNMNAGATGQEYQESLQSLIAAQGDIIIGSSANTPKKISKGTSLQQFRMNVAGTEQEYYTPPVGWERIERITLSSPTQLVSFLSNLSDYSLFKVMYSTKCTKTGSIHSSADLWMDINAGVDAQTNYDTSGGIWYANSYTSFYEIGVARVAVPNAICTAVAPSGMVSSGVIYITNPTAGFAKTLNGTLQSCANNGAISSTTFSCCARSATSRLSSLRFYVLYGASNEYFAAGSEFTLMGLK